MKIFLMTSVYIGKLLCSGLVDDLIGPCHFFQTLFFVVRKHFKVFILLMLPINTSSCIDTVYLKPGKINSALTQPWIKAIILVFWTKWPYLIMKLNHKLSLQLSTGIVIYLLWNVLSILGTSHIFVNNKAHLNKIAGFNGGQNWPPKVIHGSLTREAVSQV